MRLHNTYQEAKIKALEDENAALKVQMLAMETKLARGAVQTRKNTVSEIDVQTPCLQGETSKFLCILG